MKLIFATTNPEKLTEAQVVLEPFGFQVVGKSFNFNEPSEGTMEYIAKTKLSQINTDVDLPVFVDDSGIFFEAFPNFPGILTRRIFNMIGYKGIDKLLKNETRNAFFQGVIAIKYNDVIKIFHGETYGTIIDPIQHNLTTDLRFPFDPIFIPKGSDKVLAEYSLKDRVHYSYRRLALEQLGNWLIEAK